MEFAPELTTELQVEGSTYHFVEHPVLKNAPYGQEGRAAIVFKIASDKEKKALKVFKQIHRRPSLVALANKLADFASNPGLAVCQRAVLTPNNHKDLLRTHKDLVYSVVMPWIDGPTWFDILLERKPLTRSQCLTMAHGLVQTLVGMEQKGLAHCDLSGPNLIFPCLLEDWKSNGHHPVELVDVEGFYSASLTRPEILVSGTYPHQENKESGFGEWSEKADRFAGSVLLAEILGWCDERTREYIHRRGKDTFFSEEELQAQNEGYQVLSASLRDAWGSEVAGLFERAWNSTTLAQCPTFAEWALALPENPGEPAESAPRPHPGQPGALPDQDQTILPLMDLAERLSELGNREGALAAYEKILTLAPPGSTLHTAVERLIRTLKIGSSPQPPTQDSTPVEPVPSGNGLKPLDVPDLPTGEWHPVLPEGASRKRELVTLSIAFVLLAALIAVGVLLFGQTGLSTITGQTVSSAGFALAIGLVQTWLFRGRLRGMGRRALFILPALVAGTFSGALGGILYVNQVITNSLLGGLMGAIAGGVTALGQNLLMRSHSTAKTWLIWNLISWGVIWTIGWTLSWSLSWFYMSGPAASAVAAVAILALTGVSLSIFLHYFPEIEF